MRILCALITAIALQTSALAIAQSTDAPRSNPAPAPGVENAAPPEQRASESPPSRDEVEAKFKNDLDYWQGVIVSYARDARQQTSERVREETKRLRSAWEDASVKLQDLRVAAKENWQAARSRFETAYNGIENAWARLSDNLADNRPEERPDEAQR